MRPREVIIEIVPPPAEPEPPRWLVAWVRRLFFVIWPGAACVAICAIVAFALTYGPR